jgi:hypothetical protein
MVRNPQPGSVLCPLLQDVLIMFHDRFRAIGFPGENAKFWAVALLGVIRATGVSHVLPLLTS